METFLVPIIVALIATVSGLVGAYLTRRSSTETKELREVDLALHGFAALVTEFQEERAFNRTEIAELRQRLEACLKREAEHASH